jgi:hypothetical protein
VREGDWTGSVRGRVVLMVNEHGPPRKRSKRAKDGVPSCFIERMYLESIGRSVVGAVSDPWSVV